MLSIEFTPKYIPACRPWVVYPETVTVLPELLQVAKNVNVVLPPVVPAVGFENVTVGPVVFMAVTVVPYGRVKLPAVFKVIATFMPTKMPAREVTVCVALPVVAVVAIVETFAGKAQYFVLSCSEPTASVPKAKPLSQAPIMALY